MALTPDFWLREIEHLRAELLPVVLGTVLAGLAESGNQLRGMGMTFEVGKANETAAAWARKYTDELLNLVGTTNEKKVGDILSAWFETPEADTGDLERLLLPITNGDLTRASVIAVTETTRAAAQGHILGYQAVGAEPPPLWADPTGTRPFGPPGHPNCRCSTALASVDGQLLICWETRADDLVCVRPIDTPWGSVMGCRALQGVCISQGEMLGQKIG